MVNFSRIFKKASYPDYYTISLIIFSLVFYCIILFLAEYINIWEDEAYSLNTTSGGLRYAFHQSIFFESQPPVYFLLLTLWRFISDSILWARLFNFVLIIISQILLYQFINKESNRKIATAASVLFLLNPTIIFTLLEIRLFALVILISIILIKIFYESYYKGKITVQSKVLYILFAIIGIFTQYFIGFLLFANAIVLLFEKKNRSFWIYILDMLIPLGLIILYIPNLLMSLKVQTAIVVPHNETFWNSIIAVFNVLFERIFRYIMPLNFSIAKIWILRVLLIGFLFLAIDQEKLKKNKSKLSMYIIITSILFLFFVLLHFQFGSPYSAYKYTTIVFIPLFILFLTLLNFIKPKYFNVVLLTFAVFYITFNFRQYHKLYKYHDYKKIGKYLEKNENIGEPVFVYRNISAEILNRYYKGLNVIHSLPGPIAYNREFGPEQWNINTLKINQLNKTLVEYSCFYVLIIDDNSMMPGFTESKNRLMDYLSLSFITKEEKLFGANAKLYKFSNRTD